MSRVPHVDVSKIIKLFLEKKPDISPNTIGTYMSCYSKFCRSYKVFIDDYPIWLKDTEIIIKYCTESSSLSTQKTKLASFVVLSRITDQPEEVIENLTDKMKTIIEKYKKNIELQEFTEKEISNWLSYGELTEFVKITLNDLKHNGFYRDLQDKYLIRDYSAQLLLLLTFFHPIRNQYGNMKITYNYEDEPDKENNNYMFVDGDNRKKFYIILNKYKTFKKYGQLKIKIKGVVLKPLRYFIENYSKCGFLFNNVKGNQRLGDMGITRRLHNYTQEKTGRRLSTSMIRKILITKEMEGHDTIKEKQKKTKEMIQKYQHSGDVHDLYNKINK